MEKLQAGFRACRLLILPVTLWSARLPASFPSNSPSCPMPPPSPQECEIPIMIIECCSQEKTFVRYYALLGSRFCMLRKEFQVGVDVAVMPHMVGCASVTLPSHLPVLHSNRLCVIVHIGGQGALLHTAGRRQGAPGGDQGGAEFACILGCASVTLPCLLRSQGWRTPTVWPHTALCMHVLFCTCGTACLRLYHNFMVVFGTLPLPVPLHPEEGGVGGLLSQVGLCCYGICVGVLLFQ